MISVTVSWPTIERTEPESTSSVEDSIWSCWFRNRWAAARTIDSLPPTLTTATAFTLIVIASRVCAVACTFSCRLRRLSLKCASTIGFTKTREPSTTFCPALASNSSPLRPRCWREVTMIASSGLATLIPARITIPAMMASTTTTATSTPTIRESPGKIMRSVWRIRAHLNTRAARDWRQRGYSRAT